MLFSDLFIEVERPRVHHETRDGTPRPQSSPRGTPSHGQGYGDEVGLIVSKNGYTYTLGPTRKTNFFKVPNFVETLGDNRLSIIHLLVIVTRDIRCVHPIVKLVKVNVKLSGRVLN